MTVSQQDKGFLRMYGFTLKEIGELDRALTPDGVTLQPDINLSSPVWQEMLLARQDLVGKIAKQYEFDFKKKITRGRLDNIINSYYAKGKTSPWDFLKALYVPKKVVDFTTNSIEQARINAKHKITNWKRRVKRLI